eukprot:5881556-Heterocapsa_arctica.AAC.1
MGAIPRLLSTAALMMARTLAFMTTSSRRGPWHHRRSGPYHLRKGHQLLSTRLLDILLLVHLRGAALCNSITKLASTPRSPVL